jgi:uncharacterized protein
MSNSNKNGGQHGVQVTAGRVAMRDGVELNVRITRPDTPGKFPTILEYNPYRRLNAPPAGSRDGYPLVVPYLAERGYVVVQYDVRGTGSSAGFCTDMYSQDERRDGYEMVEWCAAQSWCTGAVGMIGKSYGAVVQWQVAAQNPPHLKAIVVRSGGVDLAPEFSNPGGCIRPWLFEYYAPMMAAYNFAPPDAELVGERWEQIWRERLKHSEPWGLSFIRNREQGTYWGSRSVTSDYDRIRCAVLLIEGWADWYASAELRAFQRLQSPRKVIIGPWGHYYPEERDAFPGPRIDARREYLRWFDYFLKGIENGVVTEPPVSIFVRGWQPPSLFTAEETGTWRNETTWPPESMRQEPAYFGNDGRLAKAPEEGKEVFAHRPSVGVTTGRLGLGSTTPWGMPIDQRFDDIHSVLYDSEPLGIGTHELLGEPQVSLYVSSTAEIAYFAVRLCEVAPDGASRLITEGGLLAGRRHGADRHEPLVPGQVTQIDFPLKHCAYTITPGNRLRVAVSSALFQNAWPTGQAAHHSIHRGACYPSRIALPIVRVGRTPLPRPDFVDTPIARTPEGTLPPPVYGLHHDLVADTVTCELADGVAEQQGYNSSRYTVSNRNPAEVSIESSFFYRASHPALDIRVEARCLTKSDATSYTHSSAVDIKVDGQPYFYKDWTTTVPRGGS